MTAAIEERLSNLYSSLFEERLVMNDVIRFLLANPPERNYYLVLLNDCSFQSLVEKNNHARIIDKEIRIFRTRPDKLRKAVNSYRHLSDILQRLAISTDILQLPDATAALPSLGNFHQMYGLSLRMPESHPENDLGVQLEFMSYLIRLSIERDEPKDLESILKDQKRYFSSHLENRAWATANALMAASTHPLYEALGGLMQDYLKLEAETADYIAEWLNLYSSR